MNDQLNTETQEEALESATLDGEQLDDTPSSTEPEQEEQPESKGPDLNKIIAEKAFEARENKRRAEELEARLAELEKKNAPSEPEMPEKPNYLDFDSDKDFQQALDEYADKVAAVREYRKEQELTLQQQRQQEQAQLAQQQEQLTKSVEAYTKRALAFGISEQELEAQGEIVVNMGIRPDIAQAIINDADGPLITKYLAANPHGVDALNKTTWLDGATVFGQVKQAAAGLRPKTSKAPEPAEVLSGGSIPPNDNPWGASFE